LIINFIDINDKLSQVLPVLQVFIMENQNQPSQVEAQPSQVETQPSQVETQLKLKPSSTNIYNNHSVYVHNILNRFHTDDNILEVFSDDILEWSDIRNNRNIDINKLDRTQTRNSFRVYLRIRDQIPQECREHYFKMECALVYNMLTIAPELLSNSWISFNEWVNRALEHDNPGFKNPLSVWQQEVADIIMARK
jgi:predicted HicB family RNase H-like nuclease